MNFQRDSILKQNFIDAVRNLNCFHNRHYYSFFHSIPIMLDRTFIEVHETSLFFTYEYDDTCKINGVEMYLGIGTNTDADFVAILVFLDNGSLHEFTNIICKWSSGKSFPSHPA